ncbi:hypothetical protein [Paraburkholderia fungorum]|uniref:hypothetical protein n=1 Tax=Paraburkholderia fungorum TaxID=134537 RepID=UPI000FD8B52C|nr:hypothetical protein [Paraburkholderia fungorum]
MTESSTPTTAQPEGEWEEFCAGECWWAGVVLWLWEATWAAPRLAIADDEDLGEWRYVRGDKLNDNDEAYPTHCCKPVAPLPPPGVSAKE